MLEVSFTDGVGYINYIMAHIYQELPALWPAVFVVLGGVFGSFITCALYRVPRGQSLRRPPSHCPACDARLGVLDLVPVLSWLVLRGRCRHCGVKVSTYYLGVELLCVLCGIAAYGVYGPNLMAVMLFAALLCVVFCLFLFLQSYKVAIKTGFAAGVLLGLCALISL